MSELLIGSGNNLTKQLSLPGKKEWENLTTLDLDPDCQPDVIHDLADLPLPFPDESFDEIHAYEILEHVGQQGDWRLFFEQFTEFHRLLKPGGHFLATTPMWDCQWAWADPGHSRIIAPGTISFLEQKFYKDVGENPMTDYRHVYKVDFEIVHAAEAGERFAFVLKKQ